VSVQAATDFFAGHATGRAVFDRVRSIVDQLGGAKIRISRSQVAFRRRRGFAYLWLPGQYLSNPTAEVVLSIALRRHHRSRRFKQVVHPARAHGFRETTPSYLEVIRSYPALHLRCLGWVP
jgi:hypothetical protein